MIASIRGFWRFLKESLELGREMNRIPSLTPGDQFIGEGGTEYVIKEVWRGDGREFILIKEASLQTLVIGSTEYPVVLDATLAPDEWRLEK